MIQAASQAKYDAFGNKIDPAVGYARGLVLPSPEDEVKRMLHGRGLVRARARRLGLDSLFNLTGSTRAFPISSEDLERLESQLAFFCHFDGKAEAIGVAYAGGEYGLHDACLATRVSAGFLATMVAIAKPGATVLSVVPAGRSHPSIQNVG